MKRFQNLKNLSIPAIIIIVILAIILGLRFAHLGERIAGENTEQEQTD